MSASAHTIRKPSPTELLRELKEAIRSPYAWPGGYPLYVVMADGKALSIAAARAEWRQLCNAVLTSDRNSGWLPHGVDTNWEDPALFCCHTGARIESAYAEDDAIENGGTGTLTVD